MRARGIAGLIRLPVTEKIAGSNPVGPARLKYEAIRRDGFLFQSDSARTGYEPKFFAPANTVRKERESSSLLARLVVTE